MVEVAKPEEEVAKPMAVREEGREAKGKKAKGEAQEAAVSWEVSLEAQVVRVSYPNLRVEKVSKRTVRRGRQVAAERVVVEVMEEVAEKVQLVVSEA